jgi:hypothetical protein
MWLDPTPWPTLYPLTPLPELFPGQNHWGDDAGNVSGVYLVVALDPAGNGRERRTLPRLLQPDPTGTLYIGKADRNTETNTGGLCGRLGQLCSAVLHNGKDHGMRVMRRPLYQQAFPVDRLTVCWLRLPSDYKFASDYEHAISLRYVRYFGEMPPFHSAVDPGD